MKRMIYAALAAVLMISACDSYHPYYDGQQFRIYHYDYGVIEADGVNMDVPIVDKDEYVIEIYGGKGENHRVEVEDPDYMGYKYKEAEVNGGPFGDGIQPATIILQPRKLGDTSITISDEDTGESIRVYLHIIKAYSMMEIFQTKNSLETGTVLAFEYASEGETLKMCRITEEGMRPEYVCDAKCRFLDRDTTFVMELTYPADENEQPDPQGTETVKRFLAEFENGHGAYGAYSMLRYMNLDYIPVQTKDVHIEDDYYEKFRFIDVTEDEHPDPESPDTKIFYATSATLETWIE